MMIAWHANVSVCKVEYFSTLPHQPSMATAITLALRLDAEVCVILATNRGLTTCFRDIIIFSLHTIYLSKRNTLGLDPNYQV